MDRLLKLNPVTSRPGRARRATERGAVLVETAIVTMVLVLLSFGAIEFGFFLREVNDTASAVRSGARVASNSGTAAGNPDLAILQAMKRSDSGIGGDIKRVMIFRADPTSGANLGKPIGNCKTFVATAGNCNVYDAADVDSPATVAAKSNSWSTRVPGTDYIGVQVEADHGFITRFFGASRAFDDVSVVRLEAASALPATEYRVVDGITNGGGPIPGINQTNVSDNESPCDPCGGGGSDPGGTG